MNIDEIFPKSRQTRYSKNSNEVKFLESTGVIHKSDALHFANEPQG
jgi:hypothetical protein